jgi:protein-tyrosine-phosphatase
VTNRGNKRILFLCTGNYYRSRFAEILFNALAGKRELAWSASSRGLALERGVNNIGPMATDAGEALLAMGLRAGADFVRYPMPATPEDFAQADCVIALKRTEHLPLMQERFPAWADKVEYWHVDDAPGVLRLIEREVKSLMQRLSEPEA